MMKSNGETHISPVILPDFQQDSATTHDVQYAMHPLKNAWLRLIIHDL
jgi:hypothetical protein